MKKIKMILTNAFGPDPRVYKEAKYLVENGYDVEILCWDRENIFLDKPEEIIDGVKIKRFYPYATFGTELRQLASFFKFIHLAKKYLKDVEYDFLHAHDIDGAYAAVKINKNKHIIWDMHEIYFAVKGSRLKLFAFSTMAHYIFKHIDSIVYCTDAQKDLFISRGVTKPNVVVKNAPELDMFEKINIKNSDKLRISYIGSVRDFDITKMLMDCGERFQNIQINIIGDGIAYDKINAIAKDYKNTYIHGRFEYKDILSYYEDSDIIYAVYSQGNLNNIMGFHVKAMEAFAAGLPSILANGQFFKYVEKYDANFVLEDISEESLCKLIANIISDENLLSEKKRNARKHNRIFNWAEEADNLIKFYNGKQATSR